MNDSNYASCCRFQSKYHSQVLEESNAGKSSHLTMGEAESYLPPPDRYLRKHTGTGGNHVRAKSARTHSKKWGNLGLEKLTKYNKAQLVKLLSINNTSIDI